MNDLLENLSTMACSRKRIIVMHIKITGAVDHSSSMRRWYENPNLAIPVEQARTSK